jgi:hypothetical protein
VTGALHHAFLTLGAVTMLSSLSFWALRPGDGDSVSKGAAGQAGTTDVKGATVRR